VGTADPSQPPPPPHVLIVDDDEDIAESIASLLDAESYGVAVAGDGVDAIDHAVRHRPDLILLDLKLPRLDGVGVARALRALEGGLERVPVILVSAMRQVEEAARAIGTPYFLRKPFDLDEVLTLVRQALAPDGADA
jgi:DNA-binding response OmpR family regulator